MSSRFRGSGAVDGRQSMPPSPNAHGSFAGRLGSDYRLTLRSYTIQPLSSGIASAAYSKLSRMTASNEQGDRSDAIVMKEPTRVLG